MDFWKRGDVFARHKGINTSPDALRLFLGVVVLPLMAVSSNAL